MAIEHDGTVLRHLRALYNGGAVAGLTDPQLLERFASRQDGTGELAFAALVQRHGPMVLRVCRAALRDDHDAQDAFQAVFLVLVEKAGSLWVRDSLGPWLFGVALRITARARASDSRRRAHELKWAEGGASSVPNQGSDDLGSILHEEVGRLPERYRKAVLLCDLEGLTHEAAASYLGWPVGTVKSRQARGRERLRQRLARRGLAPIVWGSGTLSTRGMTSATVPAALVNSTIQAAIRIASSQSAAGVVSASVAAMMKGGARDMSLISLRTAVAIVLAIGISAGAGVLIQKRPWAGRDCRIYGAHSRCTRLTV